MFFIETYIVTKKKVVKKWMWVNGGRINQPHRMPYVQYIIGLSTNNKLTSNKQDCIRRKSYILRIKSNTTSWAQSYAKPNYENIQYLGDPKNPMGKYLKILACFINLITPKAYIDSQYFYKKNSPYFAALIFDKQQRFFIVSILIESAACI